MTGNENPPLRALVLLIGGTFLIGLIGAVVAIVLSELGTPVPLVLGLLVGFALAVGLMVYVVRRYLR